MNLHTIVCGGTRLFNRQRCFLQISGAQCLRHPPLPMCTLEMQKLAVSHLGIPSDRAMKVAEELYVAGFISYPRTETNEFDEEYDLRVCTLLAVE